MKLTLIICCLAATLAAGQEAPPPDLDARRESVVIIKQNLAMREKRLAEVGAEIRENGATIDKKVGELVDMLAGLKDSESSKRRVSEVKGEAIAGLKRMLQVYKEERRKIVQKLAGDNSAPSEALKKDMATIDALAEKQVARILELVKSMPGGEDISKNETDSTDRVQRRLLREQPDQRRVAAEPPRPGGVREAAARGPAGAGEGHRRSRPTPGDAQSRTGRWQIDGGGKGTL
ncbi:hypothetical protein [Luteolibacter sp. Populi]|uniref:hypothetical protein n=1 Tax=Luteolibacter sp. Populi TaxID=3230487 RepID=UPI003464F958